VLKPATLATMFEPHYQPDRRVPGMGLGFFCGEAGGHCTVGHEGIWPGFLSQMVLAPDDGIGVVVFTNTGSLAGNGAPVPLGNALLHHLLGLLDDGVRRDVPVHAQSWSEVCGWYGPDPGRVTNLPLRAMLGAGVEVAARRGQLTIRGLTPLPSLRRGLRLEPDDDNDPYVFRIDLAEFGMGTCPVVFTSVPERGVTALHLGLAPLSLRKRPDIRNLRPWVNGALALGATAIAARRRRAERAHRHVRD
jgi:hypothetical protein